MQKESDLELIAKIGTGCKRAFGKFYDLHSGILYSEIVYILKDKDEALDVLQETLMQICQKASHFDASQGKPVAWALTIARNRALDRLRSFERKKKLLDKVKEEPEAETQTSPENISHYFSNAEQAAQLAKILRSLPAPQRQAIELAFFEGLTQQEIADKLGEPLGTIKARIRRGMLKMRQELEAGALANV